MEIWPLISNPRWTLFFLSSPHVPRARSRNCNCQSHWTRRGPSAQPPPSDLFSGAHSWGSVSWYRLNNGVVPGCLILQTSAFPASHSSSSPRAKVMLCSSHGNGWKTLSQTFPFLGICNHPQSDSNLQLISSG